MKKVAYFGGTFDPVHNGHLSIARAVVEIFDLDRFFFLPAFHAPHKADRKPTSEYHRYAMLSLATQNEQKLLVSTLELEKQTKRYTIETLPEIHTLHLNSKVFFVMGADSWSDIRTWRDWEKVLLSSDHIVITRPGYEISTDHVTEAIRERIVDLRADSSEIRKTSDKHHIYFTDAISYKISATELREDVSDGELENRDDLSVQVANYIQKYDLYR